MESVHAQPVAEKREYVTIADKRLATLLIAGRFEGAPTIVMLHEGRLIFDGIPEQIRASDNPVVKRFVLGEASEQELAGLRGPSA